VTGDSSTPPRSSLGSIATVVFLAGVAALSFLAMSVAMFGLATCCTTEADCVGGEWNCSPCDGVRRAWNAWLVLQGSLLVGATAWTLTHAKRRAMAIAAYLLSSGVLFFAALVSAS
jgi:hypothetical protein